MKPVSRHRNGDNFTARLNWPPSWQAHPDIDLTLAALKRNLEGAKASNERIQALVEQMLR